MSSNWVNDKIFIILLAFISLMLIVLSVAVFGFIGPHLSAIEKRTNLVCRAAEMLGDDRAISLLESEKAIRLRFDNDVDRPGDSILLANNERSQIDVSQINFILDQECS